MCATVGIWKLYHKTTRNKLIRNLQHISMFIINYILVLLKANVTCYLDLKAGPWQICSIDFHLGFSRKL